MIWLHMSLCVDFASLMLRLQVIYSLIVDLLKIFGPGWLAFLILSWLFLLYKIFGTLWMVISQPRKSYFLSSCAHIGAEI